jgi:hypothetical protein
VPFAGRGPRRRTGSTTAQPSRRSGATARLTGRVSHSPFAFSSHIPPLFVRSYALAAGDARTPPWPATATPMGLGKLGSLTHQPAVPSHSAQLHARADLRPPLFLIGQSATPRAVWNVICRPAARADHPQHVPGNATAAAASTSGRSPGAAASLPASRSRIRGVALQVAVQKDAYRTLPARLSWCRSTASISGGII